MATTTTARRTAATTPAVITVAAWNAAQNAIAALQAELAELRAAQLGDNEDDTDDDALLAVDDDNADEFADDTDDATVLADEDDNLPVGYYFNADDTSAVYIADDGYGYAVTATGKHAGKVANDPSDVDMDEHSEFAGELDLTEARARLHAANEPPARPTSRRRQAEVEAAAPPARRSVNDLTPDELRDRITKVGGDPAKIVGGFHAKARTNAMQAWLKTFIKTKNDNGGDLTAAKRAATKAVNALSGRQMG